MLTIVLKAFLVLILIATLAYLIIESCIRVVELIDLSKKFNQWNSKYKDQTRDKSQIS